jgi:transposase-like protein
MSDEIKLKEGLPPVSGPEGGFATVGPETGGRPARFWAKHKVEAVLRLLRGEPLDALSRELQISAAQLSQWREAFLSAGAQGLSSRPGKDDTEVTRLNAKIGELTMANELLNQKIDHMESGRPLARRRPKK